MKHLMADLKYKQSVFARDGNEVSFVKIILSDGTLANVLYRLTQFCARSKVTLILALIFQYLNKLLNQCVIGIRADFGPGLVLMHPVGVIINSKVSGGERIVIESGVVIGDEKGVSPVLGDDLFIGAGAKIVGGLRVGNGTKIGANAVVVKDVADGDVVGGIPARSLK